VSAASEFINSAFYPKLLSFLYDFEVSMLYFPRQH